jgi:hypothetical protein
MQLWHGLPRAVGLAAALVALVAIYAYLDCVLLQVSNDPVAALLRAAAALGLLLIPASGSAQELEPGA